MPPRTNLSSQVAARLRELQPAYEEYLTLLEVQDTLKGIGSSTSGATRTGRRGPGRPPGSGASTTRSGARRAPKTRGRATSTRRRAASSNGRRRGRGRSGGTRADQALQLIKSNPGITVPQIADQMGIRQNYLYRVTAALQKQGSVKRRGAGFEAA
jgi:hypothetical protein